MAELCLCSNAMIWQNHDETLANFWRMSDDILGKFWRSSGDHLVIIWRMSDKLWRNDDEIMPEFWVGNIGRTSGEIQEKRVKQGQARTKPQLSLPAAGHHEVCALG